MSNTPRTDSMQANLSKYFKDDINDTEAFLLKGAAQIEHGLTKALADLKRLKQYTGTGAQACPLCTYDDGILLEVCGFHKLIEVTRHQRDRAEADLEAMRKESEQWDKTSLVEIVKERDALREEIERGGIEGESQLIFIEALKNDREAMRKERDDFQKQLINGTDKDKP